jgi:hypothetical protein
MNELQKLLLKYPDKPWSYGYLSFNPNITIEDMLRYPDKPWNWDYLSMNPNITMSDVEKYPDKPWDYEGLSMNEFSYRCRPPVNLNFPYIKKKLKEFMMPF